MRIAFQMDDIESLDISGDSSFALLLEAQQRGHEIFYYTPSELSMLEARVFARGHGLKVINKRGEHFKKSAASTEDLSGFDCIFLRQDPPFDMNYITSTHLLERLTPETLVVNDPAHVRNAPEKLLVTEFQSLTPPTLITRSLEEVKNFRETHREIIVKPLYGNGGAGVFHLQPEDRNLGALIEIFQTNFREPFIVQKYLPEIRDGDKRIILVDGEVAGAINRVPQENEARSNLHIGGRAEATELTPHDHEICQTLAPHLKRRGLIFTGIDVIGDYLTEINVTSPTGIREVKRFGGKDIAALIFDCVEKKISDQRK